MYDKGINAKTNRLSRLANSRTYQENAGRSDLGAVVANLGYVPRSYLNLGAGFIEGIPLILKNTVKGAQRQQKGGNLLDYLLGLVRGATFGAETGLQAAQAHRMDKVLRGI